MTTHFNAGHIMASSSGSSLQPPSKAQPVFNSLSDLDSKVKKGVGRVSENAHILANEPSVALHCLQEHIRKDLPNVIKAKQDFSQQNHLLLGTLYDCDYSIRAVKAMGESEEEFNSIQSLLKSALFYKQQIQILDIRRKENSKKRST